MQVLHTDFKDSQTVYPFCRVAILACCLTSSKHADGVQKLITKSDAERLKSVTLKAQTKSVETLLSKGWEALGERSLPKDDQHVAFGRFAVRLLLHFLKKTDREKAFESVTQIQGFGEDCVKLSKPSGSSDEKASEPLEVTDVAHSSMARLALMQNQYLRLGQLQLGCTAGWLCIV